MNPHADQTRKHVKLLGYAGLIPFVGMAMLLWLIDADLHPFVALALAGYGAAIVSFFGGIHWGIGLRQGASHRNLHLIWGVIPSILAWIAVIMPAYAGLPLLALLLLACYLVDRKTWPEAGLRDWLTLRFRLTVVSTLACLFGAGGT